MPRPQALNVTRAIEEVINSTPPGSEVPMSISKMSDRIHANGIEKKESRKVCDSFCFNCTLRAHHLPSSHVIERATVALWEGGGEG